MKKNKIYNKILIFCITMIMTLCILSNFAMATERINPNSNATGSFEKLVEVTTNLFQIAAIGIGAIMIVVLAIKYMTSAPNEKADIKKNSTIYIVGACIAFAASGIVEIIKNFTSEILD